MPTPTKVSFNVGFWPNFSEVHFYPSNPATSATLPSATLSLFLDTRHARRSLMQQFFAVAKLRWWIITLNNVSRHQRSLRQCAVPRRAVPFFYTAWVVSSAATHTAGVPRVSVPRCPLCLTVRPYPSRSWVCSYADARPPQTTYVRTPSEFSWHRRSIRLYAVPRVRHRSPVWQWSPSAQLRARAACRKPPLQYSAERM